MIEMFFKIFSNNLKKNIKIDKEINHPKDSNYSSNNLAKVFLEINKDHHLQWMISI
jgi:hypothetical protein